MNSQTPIREYEQAVYIYWLGPNLPTVKIGHTNNPDRRLAEFQRETGTPGHKASFAAIVWLDRRRESVEAIAHRTLAHARRDGEWFACTPLEALDAIVKAVESLNIRYEIEDCAGITPEFHAAREEAERAEQWRVEYNARREQQRSEWLTNVRHFAGILIAGKGARYSYETYHGITLDPNCTPPKLMDAPEEWVRKIEELADQRPPSIEPEHRCCPTEILHAAFDAGKSQLEAAVEWIERGDRLVAERKARIEAVEAARVAAERAEAARQEGARLLAAREAAKRVTENRIIAVAIVIVWGLFFFFMGNKPLSGYGEFVLIAALIGSLKWVVTLLKNPSSPPS